jgi:hypothetical protein
MNQIDIVEWPVIRYDAFLHQSNLTMRFEDQKKAYEQLVKARSSAESLNNLARESPFCIIYHEKKNDPL